MSYVRPEEQKKLVEVDVKTRVQYTMATAFLAGIIVATSTVLIGTAWAVISTLLKYR